MAGKNVVLARPYIPKAETRIQDANEAVLDFASQLEGPSLGGVLFFCSPAYDLPTLGATMKAAFDCPVFGCSTVGEIGQHYQTGSLIGVGLPASLFEIHVSQRISLKGSPESLYELLMYIPDQLDKTQNLGLLLADGFLQSKGQILSIQNNFSALQITGAAVGGHAGFGYVYSDGEFVQDVATLIIMGTRLRFKSFSFDHLVSNKQPKVVEVEDFIASLEREIDALRVDMPDILFTIGFESIARRQIIEDNGLTQKIEQLLGPLNFTGLSTQEELSNGSLHSKTLTGVVFGVG